MSMEVLQIHVVVLLIFHHVKLVIPPNIVIFNIHHQHLQYPPTFNSITTLRGIRSHPPPHPPPDNLLLYAMPRLTPPALSSIPVSAVASPSSYLACWSAGPRSQIYKSHSSFHSTRLPLCSVHYQHHCHSRRQFTELYTRRTCVSSSAAASSSSMAPVSHHRRYHSGAIAVDNEHVPTHAVDHDSVPNFAFAFE